jgi:TetR/AcrR family tetracycline transcriptional repressor
MSNSSELNRQASGKPGSYTRADVVETALRILDEFGLADLSMRRLAGVLDVQPSALYWHVPNKQTLLALVADQIIERAAVIDHEKFTFNNVVNWKALALAESIALRDALLAYRDGAEVVSSTLALGLGAGEALNRLQATLRPAIERHKLRTDVKVASESILFLILGQVWHQQQRAYADGLGIVAPAAEVKPEDVAADGDALAQGICLILDGLSVANLQAEQQQSN